MIRSPLRLLAALALVALTLFVVACGGSDNESGNSREDQQRLHHGGQEGRQARAARRF